MDSPAPSPAPVAAPSRKDLLRGVRTIVVKIGTNVVTRPSGEMALANIHAVIEDIVDLHRQGFRVILVSSGAVSMGSHRLGREGGTAYLNDKQAYAAVGQVRLMSVYQQAFGTYNLPVGQILLTEDDFQYRARYLNLRNTMNRLLELGVLPILNENDSISTAEIETDSDASKGARRAVFGDNDVLSALVASKLGADLLILLSDVDGLYEKGPPREGDPETRPLPRVDEITPAIEAMAAGGSARGRGGMSSKLGAVRIAVQSGSLAIIANGGRTRILREILSGEETGTLFLPRGRLASRKRWIAFANRVSGRVTVNAGARDAIVTGRKSLLFAGVAGVEGEFERGDVVSLIGEDGREFARGMTNYSSADARSLVGKRSSELRDHAEFPYGEFVHRDNLATLE